MKPKIEILDCCCCGGAAPARKQWWNRDTGYGICEQCFTEFKEKHGNEEAIENYGHPNIHHSIKEEGMCEKYCKEDRNCMDILEVKNLPNGGYHD